MSLIHSIKEHEGFRGQQYTDHLGFPTIGYGTKLPLTEQEAAWLLQHRLDRMESELEARREDFHRLPVAVREGLLEAAYQLGVPGLLRFSKMWAAIRQQDWERAADEALASRWNEQTPKRAQALASVLRAQR